MYGLANIYNMANFIELTSTYDHPVLINVESIAYIEPAHDDGAMISMCVSHISSFDSSGSIRSVSGSSETIYVKESYQVVKRKLSEI